MSDQNIISRVKSISDGKDATITLTDTNGERKTFDCIFKESIAPSFFLLFSSDNLPRNIASDTQFPFTSIDDEGHTVSFSAEFSSAQNSRIIEFTAKKAVNLEDFRDFFRVNITVPINVTHSPIESSSQNDSWSLDGKTVDISQSGVLAFLPEECQDTSSLEIEISLPSPQRIVFCVGHAIRIKRVRKHKWLTALHFDQLSSDDRDIIAMNCLAEQRRQLRENIQI